jgi:hypothetical protein
LFIEKSSILLVKKGYLSFITPSVFLVNESDILLRKFILDRYSLNIIATTDENIFGDASVKVVVFVLKNQEPLNNYICFFNIIKSDFLPDKEIKQNFFIKQGYLINEKINHNSIPIIDKIKDNLFLGELFEVKNGIKVRKELLSKKKSDNDFKLFVLGKNISPYYLSFGDNYINYKIENQKLFSNQAFRNKEIFEQNKLIIRQILGKRIVASFDNHNLFTDQTTYVVNNNNPHYLLKFLLCILGSRAMYYYFINTASDNKLLFPKIKRSQLLDLPIVSTDIKIQKLFEEKADAMLALNKKFHEQSPRFLQRMIDNYGLEKANKKLEKFWELDFGDFVKEMRKKGATVQLSTQDELQDYFDIKKSELLELDAQIKSTDAEINTMVYELYGLNDDEIKIIENS